MKPSARLSIALLPLVLLAAGCSTGANAPNDAVAGIKAAPPKATTPQQAERNFVQCVLKADKEGFMSCLASGKDDRIVGEAQYELSRAGIEFHDDFLKAYGEAAWKKFQSEDERDDPKAAHVTLDVVGEETLGKIDKAQVKIDGSQATVLVEGAGEPFPLVKEGEEWKVRVFVPEDATKRADNTAKMLRTLAETIQKYRKAIGKAGISPADIGDELGRAVGKAMMGIETTYPHRFDIEKI